MLRNLARRGKSWLVATLLLALAGCGHDGARTASALGAAGPRWKSFPVTIRADGALHDGGAADEDLAAAITFWESRAGKRLFVLGDWPAGQLPYTGSATDPETLVDNVLFLLRPWPSGGDWGPQIAGKTVVFSSGGSIDRAVIFLNGETALCSAACDGEGDRDRTSRRRLLAHELGHFLGFGHAADVRNIMYPQIVPGGDLETVSIDEPALVRLTQ